MEISTLFGLPAHPLFVHIPVIGIPLMALAVIAYILMPAKPAWLFWTSGALTVAVAIATVLAAGSGESLQSMLPKEDTGSTLINKHAELGQQTEIIVLVFAGLTLGYLALDWWHRRQSSAGQPSNATAFLSLSSARSLLLGIGIAAIIAGSVATVWDVRTGHAGAKSSWEDVAAQGNGD